MDLKLKVLEIKPNEYRGKTNYNVKFDGGTEALFTGAELPEEVKVGAEVECTIEEVKKKSGEGTWTAVSFPKYQKKEEQKPSGSGGWSRGSQEDTALKITSFAFSYAKDLAKDTPEYTLDGLFETANKLADKMVETYNRLKK